MVSQKGLLEFNSKLRDERRYDVNSDYSFMATSVTDENQLNNKRTDNGSHTRVSNPSWIRNLSLKIRDTIISTCNLTT